MALSDYEKQVLAELEAEFESDTTRQGESAQRAAREFAQHDEAQPRSRTSLSVRRIAAGSVIAVAGLVLLLCAVSLGYSPLSIALGAVSFLLVVGGIYFALHATPGGTDSSERRGKTGPATRKQGDAHASLLGDGKSRFRRFMADQERRWDERER